MSAEYLHGYSSREQDRLIKMNEALNERCLEGIRLEGSERILDLGCGLGILSRQLAKKAPGAEVTGLEFHDDQLMRARQLAREEGQEFAVNYVSGSVYDLQRIFTKPFDLIFTRFLLEHLDDVPQALKQCYGALRPGGRLIIIDDDHENFRLWPEPPLFEAAWKGLCDGFIKRGQDPYIGRKLVSLTSEVGFRDAQIEWVRFGAAADQPDFSLYADNLIALFLGVEDELLSLDDWDSAKLQLLLSQLRAWKSRPDAALWYAANWVETCRPSE